jgi:hypothetical protein
MYEIQTFTLCDGFVNTWLDNDDQPVTFATLAEARSELADLLWCTRHDSNNGVPFYSRDDFRIVEVTT